MDNPVPEHLGSTAAPLRAERAFSARSLLLRLMFGIVMVVGMSVGGAWLMYAAIDPDADVINGAAAEDRSSSSDGSDRLSAFGKGLDALKPADAADSR